MTDPTPATPDEADLLETAWGIIANAGGGDWTTQTYEWASAAARWRSDYFAYLDSRQQGDAVAGVYRERARLVAALARLYPASLERADPSPGFEWVVYVDLPTGQASWHVSDDDLDLFDGTPRGQGRKWDGHDDAEKHRRVDALGRGDAVAARAESPEDIEARVGKMLVEAATLRTIRANGLDDIHEIRHIGAALTWGNTSDCDPADCKLDRAGGWDREKLLGIGADGAGDGR